MTHRTLNLALFSAIYNTSKMQREPVDRTSKLDHYKATIDEWLEASRLVWKKQ